MRSTIVARAGDAADRLAEALKTAEECVDDCAVAWDDVEELSAAQKDTKEEMQEIAISDADKAFIESTKKTIVTARAAASISFSVASSTCPAAKGMKEVSEKVNSKRIAAMQKALEAAIAVAKECTDDCPAAWEEVEEIASAKSRAENRD